jgi:hypothetical protein
MRLNFFRDIVVFLFAGKEALAEVATGGPYTRGSTSITQSPQKNSHGLDGVQLSTKLATS